MKKIVLTAAIILGFVIGSYAQYSDDNGGLFGRGPIDDGMTRDGGTFSLCFPGHNFTTNWNGGSQGHDDDLLPLGNGALLLIGFGAAYALSKRNKKD
jgi:hypothetical protein